MISDGVQAAIVTTAGVIVIAWKQAQLKDREEKIAREQLEQGEHRDDAAHELRTLEVAIDKVPAVLLKTIEWQDAEITKLRDALSACREGAEQGDENMLPKSLVLTTLKRLIGDKEGAHAYTAIVKVDDLRRG